MNMLTPDKREKYTPVGTMLFVIVLLWGILLISLLLPINKFGIAPRDISSLPFILTAPFLHVGFSHLIANSLSLLILGSILITLEKRRTIAIVLHVIIWGGLGTWIIGRSGSIHIGASGVIFGMMGYLIFTGIFNRNLKTIFVSVIVFLLYGTSALFGILPLDARISWEGHLCGLVAGIVLARVYSGKNRMVTNY